MGKLTLKAPQAIQILCMEKSSGGLGFPWELGLVWWGSKAEPLLGLRENPQSLQLPAPEVMGSCSEPRLCRGSPLNLVSGFWKFKSDFFHFL